MHIDSLKSAIVKLVSTQNLSFKLIESQEFIDLMKLCNPAVEKLMFKADTLAENIMQMFWESKAKLVVMFRSVKKVCLTCDLWTSPNSKPILGITCHWINEKNEEKEILLDALEMRESHSGKNIAESVYNTLCDFEIQNKLFCITADNASSNLTMAQELAKKISNFCESKHLLGCCGHVINLAAQAGLKAIGSVAGVEYKEFDSPAEKFRDMEEDGWGTQESDLNDDEDLDPKPVIDRVRLTVKSIRASPQKRIKFEETVRIALPELFSAKAHMSAPRPQCNVPIIAPTRTLSARIAKYISSSPVISIHV